MQRLSGVHNLETPVQIRGFWHVRIRSASAELNALMDQIDANAEVVTKAISLIRALKQLIDEAIASGNTNSLTRVSATLDTEAHQIAHVISRPQP